MNEIWACIIGGRILTGKKPKNSEKTLCQYHCAHLISGCRTAVVRGWLLNTRTVYWPMDSEEIKKKV